MRNDILLRKEEILLWVSESRSKAEMCSILKCRQGTLNTALRKLGIEYAGNQSGKGRKSDSKYKTAEQYCSKSGHVSSHRLKVKLIRDGIKTHKCEICESVEWMGKPIPLELDHIDGNHFNNDFTNLRILCPNCHAQTDTNSGKNKGKYSPT